VQKNKVLQNIWNIFYLRWGEFLYYGGARKFLLFRSLIGFHFTETKGHYNNINCVIDMD